MNHAGVKSSIDSLMMFNEPTPRYPVVLLAPGVVPALPADGFLSLHLPDRFICLPLSPFICLPLSPRLDAWHGSLGGRVHLSPCVSLHLSPVVSPLWVDGFICLPVSPFICLPLSPRLDAWHGSLGGQFHLSPCVSLHLSPVVSPPGCLARLSGWTGSFVSLCLPSFVSRCLPAWMPGTALWVDGFICLPVSPFICLPLSPRLDALWVDGFICLPARWGGGPPVSPFICLPLSPPLPPGCLARLSGWTRSFVSLCLPSFVSCCLPAWMPGTALWVDGFICLPVSPFICLPLSPRLDAWHGSLGGRVHLSPCVSLHLSPVVSPPGCLARLSGWTGSFVSLCLASCVSRCLPAWMPGTTLWLDAFVCLPVSPFLCLPWMPGTALWVDAFVCLSGFTCLPLSPFICLPLSPSLDDPVWVDGFICLPLSFVFRCLPAWMPGMALWGGGVHLSPFVSLHLSPSLDAWRGSGSFVSLCLPSFLSRCLPAWMPGWTDSLVSLCLLSFVAPGSGTALWVDGFMCLPISLGLVVGRLPCLSLATPCLFVQCLVISCGPKLTIAVRGFSYEKALLAPW